MDTAQHLHLVTGKGGVGKTTVATAMALALSRQGKRVLLAEVNGNDRVPSLLGIAPVGYNMREIFDNLWVVDITSQEALKEYVLLIIRIEALYKAVFENRLVNSFLRLLPALGELTMLGKIWYELQQRKNGRFVFDAIVVDLPATGHARALMQAPHAVAQSIGAGPMKDNAVKLDAMLKDQQLTRLHVVTTPEEMPITEAQELLQLARELPLAVGRLIINQRSEELSPAVLATLTSWRDDAVMKAVPEVLQRRESRRRHAEALLHKQLPQALAEAIGLPHVPGSLLTVDVLADLGNTLLSEAPNPRSAS